MAHETAHGLAWNLKLDQNIYYTSMVGIAELRDIHKYWQEAVAINIQYLISSQLGDKYIGNVANIYYPKNNMYYTLDGDEIYGASPIVYSSYIDPIKKVPTSKSWYRGMPLTAAIYQ